MDIMSLVLIRDTFTIYSTLGKLYINGKFFCYTLEDVVRGTRIKINKVTAIPQGCYDVKITHSSRFKKEMPELLNVPYFTDIRMHGGNTSKDTSGCILAAYKKIDDNIIQGSAEKDLTNYLKKQDKSIILVIINKTNKEIQ